jgi:hypothetical protein
VSGPEDVPADVIEEEPTVAEAWIRCGGGELGPWEGREAVELAGAGGWVVCGVPVAGVGFEGNVAVASKDGAVGGVDWLG